MPRYLISFDEGAMTFPEEDLPEVDGAAHAVVREAMDAGVWVFGGGLYSDDALSVVATDGTVTDGPYPESEEVVAGYWIVECDSFDRATQIAAKLADTPGPEHVRARAHADVRPIAESRDEMEH